MPKKFYHGTSSRTLKEIRSQGLIPSKGRDYEWLREQLGLKTSAFTFLTDDPLIAKWWAEATAAKNHLLKKVKSSPVLCEVEVDPRETKLYPDYIVYQQPIPTYEIGQRHPEQGEMTYAQFKEWIRHKAPRPKDPKDWETSLKVVGSVVTTDPILPKDIKCKRVPR